MEHFSKDAQKLIATSESLAFHFGHELISSEHLLLAILKNKESSLTKELVKYKLTYEVIERKLKKKYSKNIKDPLYMEYTSELKLLITHANILSKANKEEAISEYSLMIALLSETNTLSYAILMEYKVKVGDIKRLINIKCQNKNTEIDNINDLHSLYKENKDPLIGRENELKQLINALSRRNKPNAILVGQPGVGKTAIVEELASMLEKGLVPSLNGKRIYEFDIASTVGGTKYRGEFEEKIKKILKKVKEAGNIILFVDEIHNIVHAGGAEGAIDASNILKPYLSRGDIQMIGATTEDEFENIFEKDKPLKRRFQIIKVMPSTKEETYVILTKLKPIYEDYYHNKISDEVIKCIIEYSDTYLKELSFPDKAIDVLDNTLVSAKNAITEQDVLNTFATYYKIENLNSQKMRTLFELLDGEIYGQKDALLKIKNALLYASSNNYNLEGTILSLFFVGPSGVGKSKTAFLIGDKLFGKDNILYLNMSQYQDAYSMTRLMSNVNGDGNGFIKRIKNNPHILLIIDEVEKANLEVLDFFMQILDTGGFYDLNGKYISMHNAMIIMISSCVFEQENIFSKDKLMYSYEAIYAKLLTKFRKQFLSKIDDIILFSYLCRSAGEKIAKKYLNSCNKYLHESSFNLNYDDKEYYQYGARYIKKEVKKQILECIHIKNN